MGQRRNMWISPKLFLDQLMLLTHNPLDKASN